MTVDIPVTVVGEVAPDGMLDQQLVQISVEAEATNIPQGIEVNVGNMAIGSAVYGRDLPLPPGVTLADEPDVLVMHVLAAPTAAQIEAELGEEAARHLRPVHRRRLPRPRPGAAPAGSESAEGSG